MRAALRGRSYQCWPPRLLTDEDVVLGISPGGQSERPNLSPNDAAQVFEYWWEQINGSVQLVSTAPGETGYALTYDVFLSYGAVDGTKAEQSGTPFKLPGDSSSWRRRMLSLAGISRNRFGTHSAVPEKSGCCSARTVLASDWVKTEWGAAWVLKKPIVPILLRCAPAQLPDRLSRLQCVDFQCYPELVKKRFPRSNAPAGE